MDGAATGSSNKVSSQAGASAHRVPDDNIIEILLRLPAKSVIRFRAVCTAWRRLLSDPDFLAAHSRLQPLDSILYDRLVGSGSGIINIALDTVHISSITSGDGTDRRQRLISVANSKRRPCILLSSCNGVFLFRRSEGCYLLCNPATRQWADLPSLVPSSLVREYAFYFHEPSGEYRLWCHRNPLDTRYGTWHVLSTDAAEPRDVQVHAEAAKRMTELLVGSLPVLLHGSMHWPPPHRRKWLEEEITTEIVVLDTLSETFQIMAGPPVTTVMEVAVKLFISMEGLLAAADLGDMWHINFWFLEDYDAWRWECRHKIDITWYNRRSEFLSGVMMGDDEGNIIVGRGSCFYVCNVRTKTLSMAYSVDSLPDNVIVSRHVYRQSLVQQPYFRAQSSHDLQLMHIWCK
ncbi:hypothetical protein PR202_ga28886 [Eleusine coracana subsp. coracana]|uniref:F-box domain-containing protein n=1 Tax=Eleusine coracana subsp. coracana TaxID=191504 RepID=A0AAV5DJE6_ELECO|nr:hypothetical protein PR202_ga28886 [Eleusine coracana subsp. coracana]